MVTHPHLVLLMNIVGSPAESGQRGRDIFHDRDFARRNTKIVSACLEAWLAARLIYLTNSLEPRQLVSFTVPTCPVKEWKR